MNSDLRSLQNCSIGEKGVNALNLIGDKATPGEILKAEELIRLNYGVDYPREKFSILWEMIREENWTSERLRSTLKWFLKNKKFPNWTIADWFDYSVRLYPHSWYLDQIYQYGSKVNQKIERYKINKIILYKYADDVTLPFEYLGLVEKPKEKENLANQNNNPDGWKGMFSDFFKNGKQ